MSTEEKLPKAPLIEVIFELRWDLPGIAVKGIDEKIQVDPFFEELFYKLKEKIKEEYPYHQPLPNSIQMPKEISKYVVLHQFRKGENKWPLIQLGQGIITLNHGEVEGYSWKDFTQRISNLLDILFEIHPINEKMNINQVILRYINAIEFDYEKNNLMKFLKDKMMLNIEFDPSLFEKQIIKKKPYGIDLRFSFPLEKPSGAFNTRLVTIKKEKNALLWEMRVISRGEDVPKIKKDIVQWTEDAHLFTHTWFMKLVEGGLREMFV